MSLFGQWRLVVDLVSELDGVDKVALALNVNESTVWRWLQGDIVLEGIALVAVKAILRHPEEYKTKEALK